MYVNSFKTENVRVTWHWGAFLQPLLQWKRNAYCIFCVCVCVCVLCVCVCVALVIQHAIRMRHVVISGLPVSTIFFQLSHKRRDFRREVTEHKMCVLIFSTTFVWNISHSKKNWARYDQKCISVFLSSTGYSCPILIKLEISRQIFFLNNRLVSCWRTDGRTDMTKAAVAFRNFGALA